MKRWHLNPLASCAFWAVLAAILITQAVGYAQTTEPSITITTVPHAGAGGPSKTEPIAGRARVANYAKFKVVVYAFAGGTWWVQPTVAEPLTDINTNGRWSTDTYLGSSYAALLVRSTYNPPATAVALPKVGGDVVAAQGRQEGSGPLSRCVKEEGAAREAGRPEAQAPAGFAKYLALCSSAILYRRSKCRMEFEAWAVSPRVQSSLPPSAAAHILHQKAGRK